ncbi:hypothetical protein B0H17DRAFT_1142675 [Mycena rosella]|uniref:Uncharacterized protein n=1 Tax=Mycena rosella TaxID=1033263 RepID=A0AAD7CXA7_MYCRO|nr:hypothetical protein B0H17DRAFT_1142675 [Mycena rosella]
MVSNSLVIALRAEPGHLTHINSMGSLYIPEPAPMLDRAHAPAPPSHRHAAHVHNHNQKLSMRQRSGRVEHGEQRGDDGEEGQLDDSHPESRQVRPRTEQAFWVNDRGPHVAGKSEPGRAKTVVRPEADRMGRVLLLIHLWWLTHSRYHELPYKAGVAHNKTWNTKVSRHNMIASDLRNCEKGPRAFKRVRLLHYGLWTRVFDGIKYTFSCLKEEAICATYISH